MKTGTLYIVATPIGNLEDMTLRAIRILNEVDIILAEDTRVTRKILIFVISNYQLSISKQESSQTPNPKSHTPIKAQLLSYHQHSSDNKKLEILNMLLQGKNVALVTDAGTPGISDPGNELIDFIYSTVEVSGINVVPIPGASALTSALSVSGMNVNKFVFIGFLPKKKRSKLFKWLKEGGVPFAFYESPNRILKTLNIVEDEFGADTEVFIARELTKLHETLYRGNVRGVVQVLRSDTVKGELVVLVDTK